MNKKNKKQIKVPQFLLILAGPSCAGKSTIAKYLVENYSEILYAWRDRLRWMISDYSADKYYDLTAEMVLAIIEVGLKNGLSVIQDQGMYKGFENQYQNLVKKYNVRLVKVNIEADFEILSKRFEERIEAAKKGAKISMTDPIIMKKRYDDYMVDRDKNNQVFFTDKNTTEQIVSDIIKILKKK